MIYVLDTNAFSDLMRGEDRTIVRIAQLAAEDRLVVSAIVRGEILHGIERLPAGRRQQELSATARELFASISCEPVTELAADHYATLKVERARSGFVMDENDLWIAATTLALGATLVSRDANMRSTDHLNVVDWTS